MGKKRFLLFCIALLFLIPSIHAEYEEVVFNDVLYTGNDVTIDGDVFYFNFETFTTLAVSVRFPDNIMLLLKFGDCISNNQYKVCFDSIKKEYTNDTHTDVYHWLDINESEAYTVNDIERLENVWKEGKDFTTRKEVYSIGVRIFRLLPHIKVTRKISKSKLIVGEKTNIEVSLENDGSAKAADVVFKDYFPYPYFKFEEGSYTGCTWAGETMKWEGNLSVNNKKECAYSLNAFEQTTFASKPEIKYYDGFRKNTTYGEQVTFTIYQQGVNIEAQLSQAESTVNDILTLDIKLSNSNNNYTSTSDFSMETPIGLDILNKPFVMRWDGDNRLLYNGMINKNSSINFSMQLSPKKAGNYTVLLKNIYYVGTFKGIAEKNVTLTVTVPTLKIKYNIGNDLLLPEQKTKLRINVENPNNFSAKDVDVTIESNLPFVKNESKLVYELEKESSKEFFNLDIIAPNVIEEQEFFITTRVRYMTSFNQVFNVEDKKIIKVAPKKEEIAAQEAQVNIETKAAANETEEQTVKEEKETETTTLQTEKKSNRRWLMAIDILLVILVGITIIAIKKTKIKE